MTTKTEADPRPVAQATPPPVFRIGPSGRTPVAPDAIPLAMDMVRRMLGLPSKKSIAKMLGCGLEKPYQWTSGWHGPSSVYWVRIIFALQLKQQNPDYWTADRLIRELPLYWERPWEHPMTTFTPGWDDDLRAQNLAARDTSQPVRPRRVTPIPTRGAA